MKNCYTFLLLLMTVSASLAQAPAHVQVYIRAGVGASRMTSAGQGIIKLGEQFQYETALLLKMGSESGLMTANVGAGMSIDMSKHFTLSAELNMEQKGARAITDKVTTYCTGGNCGIVYLPPTYIPASGQVTTHLTYLTLPILTSYRLGKFSALVGPFLSLKLVERQKGNYQLLINNAYASITYFDMQSSQVNPFDFGFTTGLSYALTHRFGVDLRYSQSMARATATNSSNNGFALSQTAQLSMRYAVKN